MSAPAGRARLDPFVLPSDTDARFLLLILSVVGAALFAYNWIYFALEDRTHEQLVSLRCALAQGSISQGLDDPGAYGRRASAFQDCIGDIARPKGLWIAAGLGALIVLSIAVYLLSPAWKMRRARLVPLSAEDAPDVLAELERLALEAGLTRPPAFVWNPFDRGATGLAFGRLGRYRVALGGGLVTTYYTDLPGFRAVALHELAHLRNRDVDRAYFTMALWYAFLLAAVVPLLVSLPGEDGGTVFAILWRLLALVALVYVTRNAVLRARETYADARVQGIAGGSAIGLVLAAIPSHRTGAVGRLLRVHPDPAERVAALADEARLFRLGHLEALAAGIVLSLVFHELVSIFSLFGTGSLGTHWLAALVVAPFVVGVVGVGIWRAAYAAVVRGGALPRAWTVGLALGVGVLVGERLSFDNLARPAGSESGAADLLARMNDLPASHGIVSSDVWGWGVLWPLALVVAAMLFAAWILAGAVLWLRRDARAARPAALVGLVAASVVLTIGVGIFYLAYDATAPIERALGPFLLRDAHVAATGWWIGPPELYRWVNDLQVAYYDSRWPVVPTLALIWLFPLAAGVGRHRKGACTRRSGLRRTLVIGVGGGVLAVASALLLRAFAHADVSLERRSQNEFLMAFAYWSVLLALGAQVVAAATAAAFAPVYRVLHGLFAAFVCGILGAGAIVLGPSVGSCADLVTIGDGSVACPFFVSAPFARQVFEQVLGEGFVLALAAAGLAALVAAQRDRRTGIAGSTGRSATAADP